MGKAKGFDIEKKWIEALGTSLAQIQMMQHVTNCDICHTRLLHIVNHTRKSMEFNING